MVFNNILDAVGNTPLIRLNRMTDSDCADILVKFEGLNVGGSIKTRTAYNMILDAEEKGLINKDTTIVEPTSGNQGIGLALVGAVRGYKIKIIMPDSVSEERRKLAMHYGADVILVPDEGDIGECIDRCLKVALRIRDEEDNIFVPQQFENEANPDVHRDNTGEEIIKQAGVKIDGFCAGIGGTIASLFPTFKDIVVKNEIMSEKTSYVWGALVFALGGMLIAMLAYRMKEKVEPVEEENKTSIFKDIADLRHNKTMIIVCLARTVQSISIALPWEYFFETKDIGWNVFGAEISGGTAQVVYGFIMGIPGAITLFFAIKVINRLGGNKNLLVFSEALAVITRVIAFFVGANDRFLNVGALGITMLLLGIAQIFTNMKDIAHRSLLTNSIDEVELKTGKRTEGIVFSMQNFVSKLTGAIPKFIQGYVLKYLGFDQNIKHAANQTVINAQVAPRFLKYRWHLFILGPAIGSALYLIVILFLKDDKEHTAEVERQLKAKREAAEKAEVNA